MQTEDSFTWEIQLGPSLQSGAIVTAIMLLVFTFVRVIIPNFYNAKQTNYMNNYLWFIQIFMEPISSYSQTGNQAILFIIFSNEIIQLFLILSVLFCVCLAPIYYLGVMNEYDFRTAWSMVSIAHLQSGSVLHVVPFLVLIISAIIMIVYYKHMKEIYIRFRQKMFAGASPQNYSVLLYDLPKELQQQEALFSSLRKCFVNVKQIVPVPKSTKYLNSLHQQLQKQLNYEYALYAMLSELDASIEAHILEDSCLQFEKQYHSEQKDSIPKEQLKLMNKFYKEQRKLDKKFEKMKQDIIKTFVGNRSIKIKILSEAFKYKINLSHLDGLRTLPPPLPYHVFSFNKLSTQKINDPLAKIDLKINIQSLQVEKAKVLSYQSQEIGTSCFLIFSTHAETYKAAQTRLFPESNKPAQHMAPSPYQIYWENMSLSKCNQTTRKIIVWIVVLIIFIAYLQFWNPTYFKMKTGELDVQGLLINIFTTQECRQNVEDEQEVTLGCSILYQIGDFLGGFLPGWINSGLYALMPTFYNLAFSFYGSIVVAQQQQHVHIMTFIHLVVQFVILQIILIRPKADLVDNLTEMMSLTLPQYLQIFQINLVTNVFELIAYIINQYVVWPQFSIWRIGDLASFAFGWIFGRKDRVSVKRLLAFQDYNLTQTLAYLSHCLVSGILLAVFDPLMVPLVFVAIIMHQLLIRYFVLQIYLPGKSQEGVSTNDVFNYIPEYLFYSFFCSLVMFVVYMCADLSFPVHIVIAALTAILAVVILFVKYNIDLSFQNVGSTGNLAHLELRKSVDHVSDYFKLMKITEHHHLGETKRLSGENMPILQQQHRDIKGQQIQSYMYSEGVIFNDYKSEVANDESFRDLPLSDEESKHIAGFFTHPALAIAKVYDLDDTAIDMI